MTTLDNKNKYIFHIDSKPYRAAGICLYSFLNNSPKILLMNTKKRGWEFPGGKVDQDDISLLHTAIRETSEELNGCIGANIVSSDDCKTDISQCIEFVYKYIQNKTNIYWIPEFSFKYGLFFIRVPTKWIRPSKIYDTIEHFEKNERTVHWVNHSTFLNILTSKDIKKTGMLKYSSYLKYALKKWLKRNCEDVSKFTSW